MTNVEISPETDLNTWFCFWLKRYKVNISKRTISGYKVVFSYVGNVLGYRSLKSLTNLDFIELLNDMSETGHTRTTIKQCKMVIKQCLEQAVDNRLIDKNPVPVKYTDWFNLPRKKALTISEQNELFNYLRDNPYEYLDMILVMISTGIRNGEARALTWNDIDVEKGIMYINKNLVEYYDNGKRYTKISRPKTKKSNRIIPLHQLAIKCLRSQRSCENDLKYTTLLEYGNLVFHKNGNIISHNDMASIFRDLNTRIKRSGANISRITAHMLRHTFATRCFESGMSIRTISEIMGHASVKTTLNIYTDPDLKVLAAEMRKLV